MQQAYFSGKAVNDLRDAVIVALLANVNLLTIGEPGSGKTSPMAAMMKQIYGKGNYQTIRMSVGGNGREVKGGVDNAKLMTQNVYEWDNTGSTYDQRYKAVILDEVSRTNIVTVSDLLHSMDRGGVNQIPFLGTTNFVDAQAFNEALWSRFALFVWDPTTTADLDMVEIARQKAEARRNGIEMLVAGQLPKAEEIEHVRSAAPGPNAEAAIAHMLKLLQDECLSAGKKFTYRRPTQWFDIIFAAGCYYSGGNADFATLPPEAVKVLRYAWPSMSHEEAQEWSELVSSLADPIQTLIDDVLSRHIVAFQQVSKIGNAVDRRKESVKLTILIAESQRELYELGDDARIAHAIDTLNEWSGLAVAGREIKRT